MSASTRDIPRLDRLTDAASYSAWAWDMQVALSYVGLWDSVLGIEADTDKNSKALQFIRMHLGSQFRSIAMAATNTMDLWTKLRQRVQGNADQHLLDLKTELADLKFLAADTAETFIERAKELHRRLTDAGDPTPEKEIVALVIRRLPAQFESMRSAHIMVGSTNMDLDELMTKLRTAEAQTQPEAKNPLSLLSMQLSQNETNDLLALAAFVKRQKLDVRDSHGRFAGTPNLDRPGERGRIQHQDRRGGYDERSGERGRIQHHDQRGSNDGRSGERGRFQHPDRNEPNVGGKQYDSRPVRRCWNCYKVGHIASDCTNPRAMFAVDDLEGAQPEELNVTEEL